MHKINSGSTAFIVHKDTVLLFHRDNIPTIPFPDHWGLPGGMAEPGETPLQTVMRELEEEVSFAPPNLQYIGKREYPDNQFVHYYMAYVNDDEVKNIKHTGGEGQEIAFFTLDEIAQLKITKVSQEYYMNYKDIFGNAIQTKSYPNASDIGLEQ